MKLNMTRCNLCECEMSMCTLPLMAGEAHDVRVRIEGMPAMQCPGGHKRFVVPDFAVMLMEALVDGDRLVPMHPASQRGILRKRYCCPGCHEDLEVESNAYAQAMRSLELKGLDAFQVSVELPRLRCLACRGEYVPPDDAVAGDLMKASARAFRAASVSAT